MAIILLSLPASLRKPDIRGVERVRIPLNPYFQGEITKVLPVIDLYKRFGLTGQETDKNRRIIGIHVAQTEGSLARLNR